MIHECSAWKLLPCESLHFVFYIIHTFQIKDDTHGKKSVTEDKHTLCLTPGDAVPAWGGKQEERKMNWCSKNVKRVQPEEFRETARKMAR